MTVWIAILRGVNVGGYRKLPMAALRKALEAHGFFQVQSYIQSGNIVLHSDLDRQAVTSAIAEVVLHHFGFAVDLIVLAPSDLAHILDEAPFGNSVDPSRAHVFFKLGVRVPDLADLTASGVDRAELTPGSQALYLHTPDGMSQSKLAEQLSRRLKDATTARNLRTCR